ncbi:unnamed protein product, partial [Strongylus vulgaris]
PPDTYITITFNPFYVESYLDYVEIFEGTTTSKVIGELDTSAPTKSSFKSTTNQMLVYFHTDAMITDQGWLAHWNAKQSTPPISQSGRAGAMASTNYPAAYDPFLEQLYYVTTSDNTIINVNFDVFSTEEFNDYLEVFDGNGIDAPLIAKLSGHAVAGTSLNTTANHLTMRFMTDGSIQYSGWHMLWKAI